MQNMLNEFYNYIANRTLGFFQGGETILQPGDRYCLKLDTEEMVRGVDCALQAIAQQNGVLGHYDYGDVYSTFTLRCPENLEVVIASKTNGMTDDFLAALRNATLTPNRFPILMITHSTIDTITSGTGDLAAKGMPFHVESIVSKIENDIKRANLSIADNTLLKLELTRKQLDRFSDKSSLFEYADLLTVLGRGFVEPDDYQLFSLLYDPDIKVWADPKKISARLEDNHSVFERIDRVFKHGNITDSLSGEFDKEFLKQLENAKRKGCLWHDDITYDIVKKAQDKLKRKLNNPLVIKDEEIIAYCGSPLEYNFEADTKLFIKNDGETKSKQLKKNILLFNPDCKEEISIAIETNIHIKNSRIECSGATVASSNKKIMLAMKPTGCSFVSAKIHDDNNKIAYTFKICVLNISPSYLENIQTAYLINLPKNLKRGKIQIWGVKDQLIVNPHQSKKEDVAIQPGAILETHYDKTLNIKIGEEDIDSDIGSLDFTLKIGGISIPLQICDEPIKPIELTGPATFKLKQSLGKNLKYKEGNKIVAGTKEYFARDPFKSSLELEAIFIENEWLAIEETVDGPCEYKLVVDEALKIAYLDLIKEFKKLHTVPSLVYYSDKSQIYSLAKRYVEVVQTSFSFISEGHSLKESENHSLLIGCVINNSSEKSIAMSPLHPLNVLYQLRLCEEETVGEIRENLVEKLTALYLIPYIKDPARILYQAIDQKHSPEWRFYAPASNKRYQGGRNFVAKLVCDKINQYKDHFSFMFDDIGNNKLCINLVNMGDCKEVFQGLLRYYSQKAQEGIDYSKMLSFNVNIYMNKHLYNEFHLLTDMHKLKTAIASTYGSKELVDLSELALAMTSKISCFYKKPDEQNYEYAHLTFYEMSSCENAGASHMDLITTGVALGGITSGTPSSLNADWYKTGFGTKYAPNNDLLTLATYYNAAFNVAFSGSSYARNSSIFTEIEQGQEGQIRKIYNASNWVVFVDPKVDLSFFQKDSFHDSELMIIHYSDQYTSASGYDDITVTQKSTQYNEIISDQLQKKGVDASRTNTNEIINLFNAINGSWMLRLITAKKQFGAADSYFSREKMSILAAIKLCMTYYKHPDIIWIPISLEEMLRVSGGAGLSQKDGILSAKNLGFEQRATSDDILFVGIEGPNDNIKIHLHPVEVKIGQNAPSVLTKAKAQVKNTYHGLWSTLYPEDKFNSLERKLSRSFFMQLTLVCCEKLKLYNIDPSENWNLVLDDFRQNLLNENYTVTHNLDQYIGKGTVVSFSAETQNKTGAFDPDNICLLELPEPLGAAYMISSADDIEKELELDKDELPKRLKEIYQPTLCDEVQIEVEVISENTIATDYNEHPDHVNNNEDLQNEAVINEVATEAVEEDSIPVAPVEHGMKILFGTDLISGENLYWHPNDTNQIFHTNTGIIGTMGTGKTQFTKSMITQLYKERCNNFGSDKIGILIFDYKGDYNESKADFMQATNAKVLKPYHLPFNPLSLTRSNVFKPLLPTHTANAFKDTLTKVYGLGPKQQNTLFQCIIDAYATKGIRPSDQTTWDNTPPTFDTVYSLYANNEDIKKTDSLAAAMDKLYQFQVFEGDSAKTQSLFGLLDGVVVIDLSGYDADIQSLIVAITLDLFYAQMQAAGSSKLNNQYRQLTKLILVDEADNFMCEGFPSLKKILKEGREFGVGTILSTQFLKHFGAGEDDYSKYILTWVVHNVADLKSSDVEFVFQVEGRSSESQTLYTDIKAREKHQSIIKMGNLKPKYIVDKAFWELYKELFPQ